MSQKISTGEELQKNSDTSSTQAFSQPATISLEILHTKKSTGKTGLSLVIPTLRQGSYYDDLRKNILELEEEILATF